MKAIIIQTLLGIIGCLAMIYISLHYVNKQCEAQRQNVIVRIHEPQYVYPIEMRGKLNGMYVEVNK